MRISNRTLQAIELSVWSSAYVGMACLLLTDSAGWTAIVHTVCLLTIGAKVVQSIDSLIRAQRTRKNANNRETDTS